MKYFSLMYRYPQKHYLRFLLVVLALCQMKTVVAQINIAARQVSLTQVFSQIEKQSSYVFLYDKAIVNTPTLSIHCQGCSIQRMVELLEKETNLDFRISGQQILVKKKDAVALPIPANTALQTVQKDSVQGKVVDENGQPIVGATVLIKGTKIGTSTDRMGMFKIQRPASGQPIVFQSIGYLPQELQVGNRTNLMMRLQVAAQEIQDVIISTGLQKREKSKMIGNVSSIKGEDLEAAGITTIDKALRGKMTGVYVRSNSGRPGETGSIIIRGSNTMTGNAEPLIILDGMPLQGGEIAGMDNASSNINNLLTNGIGNIPPEDIASIDILRDATAASIYGARAANGVIVITTKRGEAGKDYINYSTKQAMVMRPRNTFNFMNSGEKLAFEKQIYEQFHPIYGGAANQLLLQADNGGISYQDALARIADLSKINTDWVDVLYDNAYQQTHNIAMSGGSNALQYNVSANYQDATGTLMENAFKQGGINVKLTRNINDKLLVDFNTYSTIRKNKEGVSNLDPFRYAMFANPYERPYHDDGSYAWDMTYRNVASDVGQVSDLNYHRFNMVRELRENTLSTDYANIRSQLGLEWKFLDGFMYRGSGVVNYTNVSTADESREGTYRSYAENWLNTAKTAGVGILEKFNYGFLEENSGRTLDYTIRNTVEYNKTFAGQHYVQAFVANEVSERTNNRFFHYNPIYLQDYRMAGYPSWDDIPAAGYKRLVWGNLGGTYYEKDRSVSFISSMVYSYANRYVLNANFRSDGVDIIGSKNQFTPLWSVGLKWNGHEEQFVKETLPWINRLVLSTGYGYTGSINRSIYPFHTYTLGALVYDDVVKASAFNYGNPVLKWEKKKDVNYGIQLSVMESRLNMEANYYVNEVTDLLDLVALPVSVGRSSSVVNAGILSNRGWELSARVEAIRTKDWLWEIGANLTTVRNSLDKVYNKKEPNVSTLTTQNVEGHPVRSWFGYKFSHINPANGHMMVYAQKIDTAGEITGEETVDLSTISTADLQSKYRTYSLGNIDPTLYGGWNTRVRYKNLTFTSSFVYAHGNKIMSFQDRREGPSGLTDDITASRTNRLRNQQYRWRQMGDQTDIPFYSSGSSNYTQFLVDRDLESGAYIKCTELGFSWRADPKLFKKTIKQLQLGLYGNNLFTISPYSGTDPETQMAFGYPTTPSYTFSLNIGF